MKVYESPFVRPETVQVCAPLGGVVLLMKVHVDSAAFARVDADETVYVVATPSAVKETTAAPVPPKETVGVANGVTPGAIELEFADTVLDVLDEIVGITVNVYDTPLVRPVTTQLCVPVGTVVVLATVQVWPVLAVTV